VTGFPKISAIEPTDSIALGTAHRRDTKNIVASFQRSGIVVRWKEARGRLVATVVPEETGRAQEAHLHEQVYRNKKGELPFQWMVKTEGLTY
jgi:hypothetical protein